MNDRLDAGEGGPRGADAWRKALDFEDLCELGARFIVGELEFFPGWGASTTDEESDGISEVLAKANRAGFLTVASQRAQSASRGADGRAERRRAFVLGFAGPEALARLESLAGDELWLVHFGAREEGGEPLPVGLRGDDCFLEVGAAAGAVELDLFSEYLSADALDALAETRYVVLVDTVWGRDTHLWQALAAAFEGEQTAPPHTGIAPS